MNRELLSLEHGPQVSTVDAEGLKPRSSGADGQRGGPPPSMTRTAGLVG